MRTMRLLTVLLLASTLVFAKHPKLATDLEKVLPSAMVDVIVQYNQTPTAAQHEKVRTHGGVYRRSLDVIKAAAYTVPASRLTQLADDPDVAYISPDRPVSAAASNLTPDYKLQAVNANLAQNAGWNGAGIGVALLDSGVQDRPDLHYNNRFDVAFQYDFTSASPYDNDSLSATATTSASASPGAWLGSAPDNYGHGTHVAGIIAGTGQQSQGVYAGVAPAVSLVDLKVLDGNGQGSDSYVISAIQAAIQLKSFYNIRVMNLSLGRPVVESYKVDPLCQAVEAAWKAGIVVVAAAGNDGRDNTYGNQGYGTIEAPGNDPYVITVGAMKTENTATRSDDLIASYSSKGPSPIDHIVKPDLVAPGNRIVSLYANALLEQEYPANITDTNYFMLSGTSMATPMVSGAAALLLQQNPGLTPDQVKARLMKTAYKTFPQSSIAVDPVTGITYRSVYDIFTVGAGYLDIWAALNSSDTAPSRDAALSPAAVYNSTTKAVSLIMPSNVVWGDTVLWGSNVVWGDSVFVSATNVVWGDSVLWGSSTPQAFSLLWGSSVLWGSSSVASDASVVAINGEN